MSGDPTTGRGRSDRRARTSQRGRAARREASTGASGRRPRRSTAGDATGARQGARGPDPSTQVPPDPEGRMLGQVALRLGWILPAQLTKAEALLSSHMAMHLGQALVDVGGLSRRQLARAGGMVAGGTLPCPRCKAPEPLVAALSRAVGVPCADCGGGATSGLGQLGRYRLLREIARGGNGIVYEANDPSLGRRVALKVLLDGDEDDDTGRERFAREAQLTASLTHAGIVRIHDVGKAQDPGGEWRHYIAMAYIDGPTLGAAAVELSLAERVELLAEVAEAVGHAHAAGIVHRDLKPSNVLIDDEGRAVVTDFGLARATALEATRLTQTGMVMGTLRHMAPEQVLADHDAIGPPTDVWALGTMLYHDLTGRDPFCGDSAAEVLESISAGHPPYPRALDPAAPRALEAIALKALHPDPALRYPDAAAMAADLRRWRDGTAVSAPTATVLGSVINRVRHRRGWIAGAALALLLALAGVIWISRGVTARHRLQAALTAASAAAERGDWAAALAACERHGALAPDSELGRLAARARAALAAQTAHAQAGREALTISAGLARRLAAVRGKVQQLHSLSYLPGGAFARQREQVGGALDALARDAEDPAHAAVPALWALLGVGWSATGDPRAAGALQRAIALAPDDRGLAARLGRLYLQRSIAATLDAGQRSPRSRRREAQRWATAARPLLTTETGPGGGLDAALVAAHLAYAAGRRAEVAGLARAGLAAYDKDAGAEAFCALAALVAPDMNSALAALDQALERRPHYAWARFLRGGELISRGRHEPAIVELGRALEIWPRWSLALALRGTAALLLSRWADAERDLTASLERDPEQLAVRTNRAYAWTMLGRFDPALADCAIVLKAIPDDPAALTNRGLVRHLQGNLVAAGADFARSLDLDPKQPVAWVNKAAVENAAGNHQAAAEAAAAAIELDPRSARAYNNRGRAYQLLNQLLKARADLDQALRLDPQLTDAYINRSMVRLGQGDVEGALRDCDRAIEGAPKLAGAYANRGQARAAAGNVAGAIADYQRAIRLDPRSFEAYHNRGQLHYQQGRPAEALADFERALAIRRSALTYHARALIHYQRRQLDRALKDCDRALDVDPRSANALLLRGAIHRQLGHTDEALADYGRAIAADPRMHEAHYNRSILLVKLGRAAEALADLTRAVELAPRMWAAWEARGELRAQAGDPVGARSDFDRALTLHPRALRALYGRAALRLAAGDHAGAIADASAAIAIEPRLLQPYLLRGQALAMTGKLAAAEIDLTRVLRAKPDHAQALETRGRVRGQAGRLDEAERDLRAALEVDADRWTAWHLLSRVLGRSGDGAGAREALQKAVRHAPPARRAALEAELQRLGSGG